MARVRGTRNRSDHDSSQSDATGRQAEQAHFAHGDAARNEAARARANELTALPTGGRATQAGDTHLFADQSTINPRGSAASVRSRGFTSVLRNRYFLRLWMAQLISQ